MHLECAMHSVVVATVVVVMRYFVVVTGAESGALLTELTPALEVDEMEEATAEFEVDDSETFVEGSPVLDVETPVDGVVTGNMVSIEEVTRCCDVVENCTAVVGTATSDVVETPATGQLLRYSEPFIYNSTLPPEAL